MIHLLMASANCYATTISQALASSGAIRRRSCFLLRLPLFNPYRLLFYHRLLFYLDNHFSEEDIIRGAGAASRQAPRVLPPFPSPLPSHTSLRHFPHTSFCATTLSRLVLQRRG